MAKKYKLKNQKSVAKRFKIRKSGKVQRLHSCQGHYNANDNASQKNRKKGLVGLIKGTAKQITDQMRAR